MPKHFNFVQDIHSETYTFNNSCFHCGTENIITLNKQDYLKWKTDKVHINEVLPWLSRELLELCISGTHEECWNEMFSPEAEEDPYISEILDATKDYK